MKLRGAALSEPSIKAALRERRASLPASQQPAPPLALTSEEVGRLRAYVGDDVTKLRDWVLELHAATARLAEAAEAARPVSEWENADFIVQVCAWGVWGGGGGGFRKY